MALLGSSKNKWFQLFTRPVIKTTTTPASLFSLPSVFTCAGRVNGYYADPVHCHKFHYCGTGMSIDFFFFVIFKFLFSLGWHSVMECEKGLAYSARDHDCVPVELANCATKNPIKKQK